MNQFESNHSFTRHIPGSQHTTNIEGNPRHVRSLLTLESNRNKHLKTDSAGQVPTFLVPPTAWIGVKPSGCFFQAESYIHMFADQNNRLGQTVATRVAPAAPQQVTHANTLHAPCTPIPFKP